MNQPIECIRCHTPMEVGYVADVTNAAGAYQVQPWSPGEPQSSFWTGLKVDKDQWLPVRTLRCPDWWVPGIVRKPLSFST